ncbi:hypothetical protein G6F35_013999 [Rhizopus arrhizus]|nr:hypothetical protein G6F35_013999 [Rhizopus arrhizus]
MRQRRRGNARAIVIDAGHAVEQVGEAGGAGLQCGHAFLVGTGAVAELHTDAHRCKRGNQRGVLADLRRQRHHPDRGECVQLLHQGQRRFDRAVGLRAQPLRADEGALQMHADNARGLCIWCRHRSGHALQRVLDFVQAGGHGGRQQRGGTKAQMGTGNGARHVAALHQVHAGCAMHMQVDEAGQDHRQLQIVSAAVVVHLQLAHVRIEMDMAAPPTQWGEDAALQGAVAAAPRGWRRRCRRR